MEHQGDLTVVSRPRKGTTFTLTIPQNGGLLDERAPNGSPRLPEMK